MSEPAAFPLAWPHGWPRTPARAKGTYRTTLAGALANLKREVAALMGASAARTLILSSNVTLGNDAPADPGVVAYVTWEQQQIAIPCDRWTAVAANVQAIALTIEAMRAIERHGAKHMVKAMFSGFVALPSPAAQRSWREVLGFDPVERVTAEIINARRRRMAAQAHPDRGGSHAAMAAINAAADAALKEIG